MEEEETPPRISINPTSIDFGPVGYLRSITKTLEVRNTGKVGRPHFLVFLIEFDPWEGP